MVSRFGLGLETKCFGSVSKPDFDLEAKMSVLAGLEANILVLALSREFHLGLNSRLQNSVPVSKISPRLTALLVP